jgi:hypothetical protein
MRCNCLKPSKLDDEVAPTPRVIPKASGSQANQPPVTKSSVPQKYVAADTVPENETGSKTLPDPLAIDTTNGRSKIKASASTFVQSVTRNNIAEQLTPPKSPPHEITNLWKTAYIELRKTECRLIEDLEAVIKADVSLSAETDLKDQIDLVVKLQKDRMESRQWSFPWFGKTLMVREAVGNIFSMLGKGTELVSMGMNFAPTYVSLAWSAVAALLPVRFYIPSSQTVQMLTASTAHDE